MRKILFVILFAALILSMCGCRNTPGGFGVRIRDDFIDPETDVHYLVVDYQASYGFGIAPRYNSDGTLIIEPQD